MGYAWERSRQCERRGMWMEKREVLWEEERSVVGEEIALCPA
jgi:hypothetical protein